MGNKQTYISYVPKPLLDDFVLNRVVPFVGAGFSKNADIPAELSMPDWDGLGAKVAMEIDDYKYANNALDTLSYYEMLYSRPKLIELLLRELHIGKVQPGSTYKAFCELFTDVVCTTNFDCLLEDAYRSLRQPVSVIATEDRLSIATEGETKVLKLHGDVNHPDRMVVTEKDYDVFINNNPILATYVSSLFITNTMLLVGYSLDDFDFRGLWQLVNSRLGQMSRPAYCVMVGATDACIARFRRRNIKVINLPGKIENYKQILRDFFEELKEYVLSKKKLTSMDEKISEQLIIPVEENRLCYLSCSTARLPLVYSMVQPIMENVGITPVRLDQILMPGDNWMNVAKTIMSKTKFAIVDISDNNPNVLFEAGVLQGFKSNILFIAEDGSPCPPIAERILNYSFDQDENETNGFLRDFEQQMKEFLSPDTNEEVFEDAERLWNKKEYSACIVLAMSEMEIYLPTKERLASGKYPALLTRIRRLLEKVKSADESLMEKAKVCVDLRNRVVHQQYKAQKDEAKWVLEFVRNIYEIVRKKENGNG